MSTIIKPPLEVKLDELRPGPVVYFPPTPTDSIEKEIQAKGLTAPRVTLDDIEANIHSEHYFTAADALLEEWEDRDKVPGSLELLTFCVLVLKNGFTVTSESSCISPENFDAEIGRKIARQNAAEKIWPLMGYALKQDLFERLDVGTHA